MIMVHTDLVNAWSVAGMLEAGETIPQADVWFGLYKINLMGYQGHVIPVIIAVWFMCFLEKRLHKIVPEYLAQGGYAFTLEPHLTVFDGLGSLEREGQTSDVGSEYVYSNNDAAFDVACKAFQKLLDEVKA